MRALITAAGLAVGMAAVSGPAAALDLKSICVPDPSGAQPAPHLDRGKLVRAVLDGAQIADVDIDVAGGALTDDDRLQFLADPITYCRDRKTCSEAGFDHGMSARGALWIQLKAWSHSDPGDKATWISGPVPAPGQPDLVKQFLVIRPGDYRSACPVDLFKDQKAFIPKLGDKDGQPAEGGNAATTQVTTALRLRGSVDDLGISADADAFKKAGRAQLSISQDRLIHNTSVSVEGALGVAVIDTSGNSIIPYVYYKRQHVAGANPDSVPEVNNLALGVLGSFDDWVHADQRFVLGAQVLKDLEAKTELLSFHETWSPLLKAPTFSPTGGFALWARPSLTAVVGHVLKSGTSADFKTANNYGRIGPQIDATFAVFDGPFSGWSVSSSFTHLEAVYGKLPSVQNWTGDLSFTFPKTENLAIDIKYVDGRDSDTLKKQKLYTVGIGLKY